MTDLSRVLREKLSQCSRVTAPRSALSQLSIDGTRKYLFELNDGDKSNPYLSLKTSRHVLHLNSSGLSDGLQVLSDCADWPGSKSDGR